MWFGTPGEIRAAGTEIKLQRARICAWIIADNYSHDWFAIGGGELKRGATDDEQNKVNGAAAGGDLCDRRRRMRRERGEKGSEVSPCSARRGRTWSAVNFSARAATFPSCSPRAALRLLALLFASSRSSSPPRAALHLLGARAGRRPLGVLLLGQVALSHVARGSLQLSPL